MNDNDGCGLGVVGFIVGALVGIFMTAYFMTEAWEDDSVSKGKAEFILNEKDGTSTWRWKE